MQAGDGIHVGSISKFLVRLAYTHLHSDHIGSHLDNSIIGTTSCLCFFARKNAAMNNMLRRSARLSVRIIYKHAMYKNNLFGPDCTANCGARTHAELPPVDLKSTL